MINAAGKPWTSLAAGAAAFTLFLAGCGGGKTGVASNSGGGTATKTAGGPAGQEAKPTKDEAVKVLQGFWAALEAKDFDKALTFLQIPDNLKDKTAEFKKGLVDIPGSKELSTRGIEVLTAKGKWGKLGDILDKDEVERLTERSGTAPASCYGLFADPRKGAAFFWNGKQFKIIYFNNIGRLE